MSRRGINRVNAKVAESLKLIPISSFCTRQRRLNLTASQSFQRFWIYVRNPIGTIRDVIRILLREEMIVESNFGFQRMTRGYPVNRRFHLAIALRQSALRFRVIATVNFSDFSCLGVLDHPGTFDDISIPETHFATR